jgi:ATP-dependent helicase HrpB
VQTPLPIDEHVDAIVAHVRARRTAVVVAPPGSGKTTRIPPALSALGRTILLQPRRIATRALARRIASERGWTLGEEIGWQIRFERRFSAKTQLLVATEGILTARLQSDPLLSEFDVVVLDEFHERSIHADLALALVKQAFDARDDLHVVVMSATIDAGPVAQFLDDARVIDVAAPRYPIDVRYRPGIAMSEAVRETLASSERGRLARMGGGTAGGTPLPGGDILCFLPGKREIERTMSELRDVDALVVPLHGSLDVDAQERAIAPAARRKVILATNIAETSLTVEGVTDVIDSGLHKVLRYDAETAVDHLVTERIPLDSAEQRAGRAGRTGPGRATRLWDARDILRPHRDPEVRRVDLAGPALDIISWGGDPKTFAWFERPQEARIDAAVTLIALLDSGGGAAALRAFPLHPRHARIAIAANGADDAIAVVVQLSEGGAPASAGGRSKSPAEAGAPFQEIAKIARRVLGDAYRQHVDDEALRRALLAGYPDRVAMRRESGSPRFLLAGGTGAVIERPSSRAEARPTFADPSGEFVVVTEITGDLIRRAYRVEREWLEPTRREVVHTLTNGRVRAIERDFYFALPLREQSVPPDSNEASRILGEAIEPDPLLARRAAFAGVDVDWRAVATQAAIGKTRLDEIDLASHLPFEIKRAIDSGAPSSFKLPSGRSVQLDYRDDGSVLASAKLQELFGLAETPRLGARRTPITFALLSPAGRPVQVTQDLRSFWNGTYQEVRKELRPRYPKHPWPEDPWNAEPTHRTRRR